jgi:3D (Asp-Asp-Asp) domain-containing protein
MRILIILALILIIVGLVILGNKFREDAIAWQQMYASEAKSHETTMKIWQRDIYKYQSAISETEDTIKQVETKISSLQINKKNEVIESLGSFEATAYDLSIQSTGKEVGDVGYGITANGTSLIGKSRIDAMAVAVDPNIIPLGTKLLLKFKGDNEKYTGIYTAVDTGSAIKGNIVDVFVGDYGSKLAHQNTWNFGRKDVEVYIIN